MLNWQYINQANKSRLCKFYAQCSLGGGSCNVLLAMTRLIATLLEPQLSIAGEQTQI